MSVSVQDLHRRGAAVQEGERPAAEELVAELVGALAVAGEYVTRLDPRPLQGIVDFTWVARLAGRQLGIRVQVDVDRTRPLPDGSVWARVTPTEPLA